MLRFLIGFALGILLTIYSLGFIGMGHGTAVPMVTTIFLIAWANIGGWSAILLAPLLWGLYFYLIPKLKTRLTRLAAAGVIVLCHLLTGIWSATQDPAFGRTLNQERGGLIGFAILFCVTSAAFLYIASRGVRPVNQ